MPAVEELPSRSRFPALGRLPRLVGIYAASRGIGLLRELGIAFYFGTAASADRFGLAFSVAALASLVLTESSYAAGFRRDGHARGTGTHAAAGLAGYVALGVVGCVAAPEIRDPALYWLLVLLAPSVAAAPWIGQASARLTVLGRVGYINGVQILFNVGSIGGLILPSVVGDGADIAWVAAGWSLGNLAAAAVLSRAAQQAPASASGPRRLPAVTLAAALMGSQTLVDRLAAAGVGHGAVAAFGYAERFMLIPAGFVLAAFGPLLIHEALQDDVGQERTVRRLRQLNHITVPATLLFFGFVPYVVTLTFGRGHFGADSERLTTAAMQGLSAGIPLTCLMLASVRLMQSRGNIAALVFGAATGAGANLVLSVLLGHLFGIGGVAAATTLAAAAACLAQSWRLSLVGEGHALLPAAVFLPAAGAAALCGLVAFMSHQHVLTHASSAGVSSALALAAFMAARRSGSL